MAQHLLSALSFDRAELEQLILLSIGWEARNLRPGHLPARRVAVVDTLQDERHSLALDLALTSTSISRVGTNPTPTTIQLLDDAIDAVVLLSAGPAEEYVTDTAPVIRPCSDEDDLVTVLAQLHSAMRQGQPVLGLEVVWHGPAGRALNSWLHLAGDLPITVLHSGGRAPSILGQLEAEGMVGTYQRVEHAPPNALDISQNPSVRTLAYATAALLELGVHSR